MRGLLLLGCIALALVFCPGGCDWKTVGNTGGGLGFDVTGDYTITAGWTPFDDIMIWQTGTNLRAVDSREIVWIGNINSAQQAYLQAENQQSGLTEWLRGRIWVHTTLLGTVVRFEGIYQRSDDAETNWFELDAYYNADQWPEDEEVQQ
jgi:hypothetical protein